MPVVTNGTKLTVDQVKEIKTKLINGWSNVELSNIYGVAQSTMSSIKNEKIWKLVLI